MREKRMVGTTCPFCHKDKVIEVDSTEYFKWRQGKIYEQDMSLTVDEREALITGICPECWEKTFSMSDEDEGQF